ncbi:hypothetical protein [Bacillus sp. Marseille-P3661]|uniref:hypothetical protein n=1 Tax=Bacillus sp. Marseille-P3661 TaxID=1936234 RepID=UPI000C83BB8E|nr:hypothetical protein [Bacillus sp. Marseille-P3661]
MLPRHTRVLQNALNTRKNELLNKSREMENQLLRMQDNIKEIAKKAEILGIEQTKEEKWVIVYSLMQKRSLKILIKDCETAYLGKWDFCMETIIKKDHTIFIADIKGPENYGYGTICMKYLKDIAIQQNMALIYGELAERDWGHLGRLIRFYKKNRFKIQLYENEKYGKIEWNPIYG